MIERESSLLNRTKEEMFNLLVEHAGTGLTVKQFCEQKGLSPGMFYYWRKKYKSHLTPGDQQAGGFTLLALERRPEEQLTRGLFAEYKGIRFYQQPSADFFKQLIG